LIDLVELKLLPHFFALEFEFLTTELVLAELFEEQYQSLLPYIDNGKLIVHEMTGDDLTQIYLIQAFKPTLSEQCCSAFYQARQHTATLSRVMIPYRLSPQSNNLKCMATTGI
jgi:hypothetical protein